MEIEIQPYQNVIRKPGQAMSQGLYLWRPARTASWGGQLKAGIFQLNFVMESTASSLAEIVEYYISRAESAGLPAGKYNVRALIDFERVSVTFVVH